MTPSPSGSYSQAGVTRGPFRRVLVAWDSPDSAAALRMAAAIVGRGQGVWSRSRFCPDPPRRRRGWTMRERNERTGGG